MDPNSRSPGQITAGRVRDFVRQFQHDDLVEAALRTVEHIELIGRRNIADSLRAVVDRAQEPSGTSLCVFGANKDSSAVNVYYAQDVAEEIGLTTRSLSEAVAIERPIVLVDDFLGSGTQAISILEQWLGVEPTVDLHEGEREPLPPSLRNRLLDVPTTVVFAAGWEEGKRRLENRASELGFKNLTVQVVRDAASLPVAFGRGIFQSPEIEQRFRERCEAIGMQLLLIEGGGHDEAWARARAVGYGNRGVLIAFPYNTPAQTLTCLWATGIVDGVKWQPLLRRRAKL